MHKQSICRLIAATILSPKIQMEHEFQSIRRKVIRIEHVNGVMG